MNSQTCTALIKLEHILFLFEKKQIQSCQKRETQVTYTCVLDFEPLVPTAEEVTYF